MFSKKSDTSGSLGRNSRSVIWETCSCKRPACRLRLAEAQMFSRSRPSQRWTRCHQHIGDTGCLQKVKGIKPTVYFQSICNRIQSISCLLLDIENPHERVKSRPSINLGCRGNWTWTKVNSGTRQDLGSSLFSPTALPAARNTNSYAISQTTKGPHGKLWNPKKGKKKDGIRGFHSFTTRLPEQKKFGIYRGHKTVNWTADLH